jgi:hypothetical protein
MRGPHRGQQLVTDVVAQGVIDGLEVIEVEEQHGDLAFVVTVKRMVQVDPECGSVRQVRQRVVERLMGELGLQCLALADVTGVEDETADRRQFEQVGDGDLGRTVRVIFAPEPAFQGERRARDVDRLVDLAEDLEPIVGMNEVSERHPDELGIGIPKDPLHRGALVADQPVAPDQRDDIRGVLNQRPEMLLAFGELRGVDRELPVEHQVVAERQVLADHDEGDDREQAPKRDRFQRTQPHFFDGRRRRSGHHREIWEEETKTARRTLRLSAERRRCGRIKRGDGD